MSLDRMEREGSPPPSRTGDQGSPPNSVFLAFRSESSEIAAPLEELPSDTVPAPSPARPVVRPRGEIAPVKGIIGRIPRQWLMAAGAVVLIVAAASVLWNLFARATKASGAPATGIASITSRPDGLVVLIDETVRGKTPLKLNLPLGVHWLKVQAGDEERSLPLIIEAGSTVAQDFDLRAGATSERVGRLDVTSDPAGSRVRVDGAVAGVTPLTLASIAAGNHLVEVGTGAAAVKRSVSILPGTTASIVASIGASATRGGWVSFDVPFEIEVFEAGRLIGTSSMDRVMLPAGAHTLDLVNAALAFRKTISVQVAAGAITTPVVPIENGSLSVNALPWADVEVDGRPIGTTPLANVALPIGSHEIVWKHPQHGERRKTVVIAANSPTRIAVDFSQ